MMNDIHSEQSNSDTEISRLNHYANGDGTYNAYINNGDGSVVATCYPNSGEFGCNNAFGAADVYGECLIAVCSAVDAY